MFQFSCRFACYHVIIYQTAKGVVVNFYLPWRSSRPQ